MSLKIKLFILTIILLMPIHTPAIEIDRVVAVVNKEVVTWGELYRAMEFELRRQIKSGGIKILNDEQRTKFLKANEARFLEELIDRKLQLQEARRLGIDATDMEIDGEIEMTLKANSISHEQFINVLKEEGLTLQDYRKILVEEITLAKVIGREVRSRITVTENEIRNYIIATGDDSYRVWQIFFKMPSDPKDKKTVEEKAFAVLDMLRSGADFQELAKDSSEEPAGREGGDLGILKTSEMSEAFREALKGIRSDGISSPFWSAQGMHIIKVQRSSTQNTEEIKEFLLQEKLMEEHRRWIKGLREKSFIEVRL
ncbi:MAG: peptidylprolyl isomerase [Nitrospirae bacterium]|nr:peptidylprolyl isomerase [Nitrospirota bacterium]